MEILEIKNIITETRKKSIDEINNRMHRAEQMLMVWKIRGIFFVITHHKKMKWKMNGKKKTRMKHRYRRSKYFDIDSN